MYHTKEDLTMKQQFIHASFWQRLVAYIIDGAILSVLGSGITTLLFLIGMIPEFASVLLIVVYWLYFASMESSHYQSTIGKIALGLVVIDKSGSPLTFKQATGRFFGKFISTIIFGIGFLMIAFTKKKQGLHDIMADCYVIQNK